MLVVRKRKFIFMWQSVATVGNIVIKNTSVHVSSTLNSVKTKIISNNLHEIK